MSHRQNTDLTHGNTEKTLLRMATPMMFAISAVMLFNLVDTLYVGQLGKLQLAAMGFTFPVVFIIMSISMGIGMGTTSVISRAIGSNDQGKIKRITTDALLLAAVVIVFFSILGLITVVPLFTLLGAPKDVIPFIEDYMHIWYSGVFWLVIPMVGNSALRATGNTKTPSYIMIGAGLINVILDPLLIFGIGFFPRMELKGAATATVISWVFAFFAVAVILVKRKKMISLKWPQKAELLHSWKEVLHIGLPASATNMLMPLSTAVIIRILSNFGNEAVAGFGVGVRIESIAMVGIMAMSSAVMPFVGQNFGANRHERIRETVVVGGKFSFFWSTPVYFLLVLFSVPVAALFSHDTEVTYTISVFLLIVPLTYGFYGLTMIVGSVFNGMNKPLHSSVMSFLRLFVFVVPLSYVGSQFGGVKGVFIGLAIGNCLAGCLSYLWLKRNITLQPA